MLITSQKTIHETTGRTIYTRATLHFLCIFICSSSPLDQSHSLMENDCARKLPGCPLSGTTECETGLFRQHYCKIPFYKHYLHYKFLKLYELLMFLEFLVTLRYLEALPWFHFRTSKGKKEIPLTLFRMGFFGAAHGWRGKKTPTL